LKDIPETLLATFQAEHAEHLEHIRSILALLENVPEAIGRTELDEAFRRAHSLKGAARAVDLRPVEGLASNLETLFSRVREGSLHLDKTVTGIIHQALDSSEDCLAAFCKNRTPAEPAGALEAIEQLLAGQSEGVEGHRTTPVAPNGASTPETPPPGPAFQPIEMVRLPSESLDRLVRSTGQILTESLRQRTVTEQLGKLGRHTAEMEGEWNRFRKASATPLRRLAANPEFSPVTRYIEFVEEKVRALADQSRRARFLQQRSAWNMQGLAEQLQRVVWSARMVPAESLFEGFRKMVRDLARDEGKEIEYQVDGSGVRADRMVLQALKDPVMHLLRNAISHGIETPRERESKGKAPAGTLTLHIESRRGRLMIDVEDDGRGVDFDRVAKVAAERGFVSPGGPATASPEELARILFRPGFSTSPTVTDLSGRGMGLSVVDEAARRLQGEAGLRRKESPGTSMVLSVPLSVSTYHLLLVSSQEQIFGIPTHGIERLHRIKVERVETVEGRPVINLEGSQIALFSLAHLLRIEDGAPAFTGDTLRVMVLRSGAKRAAVLVDEFIGEQDALIQDLGVPCPPSGNVTGGVLLREGTVFIVLNPVSLVEGCTQSMATVLNGAKPASEAVAPNILVVDDSITTRSLEKSILEAHGYRVRVAVDGLEALQLLRAEKASLVVADIQMPRLDGFGLLQAMKADKQLGKIPVIIVSSLERAEDQQRGLTLGADAYVVKRKFDQQELLEAIQQLL
jgi:two-component system chemotaxis sensor kinase CheA